jgi:hypothetical protein
MKTPRNMPLMPADVSASWTGTIRPTIQPTKAAQAPTKAQA